MWKAFIVGVAATLAALAAMGLLVMATGAFDVRASTPHHRIIAEITHTTMIHDVQRSASRAKPPVVTPAEVAAGFAFYEQDCVSCHGAPGVARAGWASGLVPSPPYLVDAPRHWSEPQLHWIVANGVKMTAMPSWRSVHSEAQIADLVAFLEAQPYLSARDYARMRAAWPRVTSASR
ncbi:MAG TPA: cytochrome c [Caulobacteraceae bacterium]|jgi:mono/diheme cytochrome c family protein